MSQTDLPPGSRPNCSGCGEHRWAYDGYCLGVCAGPIDHPDYPLTAPEEMKWNRTRKNVTKKSAAKLKVKKPPAKGRRAMELQYEARGERAPWLTERKPEGS